VAPVKTRTDDVAPGVVTAAVDTAVLPAGEETGAVAALLRAAPVVPPAVLAVAGLVAVTKAELAAGEEAAGVVAAAPLVCAGELMAPDTQVVATAGELGGTLVDWPVDGALPVGLFMAMPLVVWTTEPVATEMGATLLAAVVTPLVAATTETEAVVPGVTTDATVVVTTVWVTVVAGRVTIVISQFEVTGFNV
jgi:hypothetical protein